MNVGSALGFPMATPSIRRTDARPDANNNDAPRSAASTAQFAAFLSMIVTNNPKVRSDLLKQLPEESAGLLDHLLADGEVLAETPNAADTARYGMMTETARANIDRSNHAISMGANSVTAPIEMPAVTKAEPKVATKIPTKVATKIMITSADINAALLAEVRSTISGMQSGTNKDIDYNAETNSLTKSGTQSRLSQAVLSRIASKKGVSVEEMMAVGDTEGAQARQGLDALLAKAGTPDGMNIAAIGEATNALSSALAISASDVGTPVRNTAALDPELQSRLMRVIDRMKNEFGHDVTVVETARSQERQNMLYEQGRTTPGSVVTWTKDSLHTQGEAVDLVVDGNWKNTQGFARLQQIVKEEGLHTIPNDPGHVELPRDSWSSNADVRVQSFSSSMPNTPTSNGIARVATVARVASVASTSGIGAPVAPQIPQPTLPSTPLDASLGIAQPRQQNAGSKNASSEESTSEQTPKRSLKATEKVNARPTTALGDEGAATPSKFIGPVAEPSHSEETKSVNGAERIQQIDTLRETQSVRPLSQITLEVDGPDGVSQQITVGISGTVVDTHISADSNSAERLRSHVNELKAGLESRGLEADTVRISTQGARINDAAEGVKTGVERDAIRLQGAGHAGMTNDPSPQHGARDRSSAARDWEDKQSARDEQRAQHRDAQGRGSGNQDRQRPQYQEQK
ncbi:MAG: M15 family metallopeptidase [Gemmatimonadaceae bacterium]